MPLLVSSTKGAENLAPPIEGRSPITAGIRAITILWSFISPLSESTIFWRFSVFLKTFSKTIIIASARIRCMVVASISPATMLLPIISAGMENRMPIKSAPISITSPRFHFKRIKKTIKAKIKTILIKAILLIYSVRESYRLLSVVYPVRKPVLSNEVYIIICRW